MEDVDGLHVDYRHVQRLWVSQLELTAARGLGHGLALELRAPLRHVTTGIRFVDPAGAPYSPAEGFIHHRNETLVKPSDPWLLFHGAVRRGPWALAARAGATIPLGRTEPDPNALGDAGLPHQHLQFGTGTVDPLLGLAASRRAGAGTVSVQGTARLTLATNGHGHRAGNRLQAGLSYVRPVRGWRPRLSVDVARESAERWHGEVDHEEGNLGRTDVFVGIGAGRGHWLGGVQLPVRQRSRGAQLDTPVVLAVAWSR